MGEHYVRPPLLARELPPRWRAVWRFRLAALLLLALLVVGAILLFGELTSATGQDPGLGALTVGLRWSGG